MKLSQAICSAFDAVFVECGWTRLATGTGLEKLMVPVRKMHPAATEDAVREGIYRLVAHDPQILHVGRRGSLYTTETTKRFSKPVKLDSEWYAGRRTVWLDTSRRLLKPLSTPVVVKSTPTRTPASDAITATMDW